MNQVHQPEAVNLDAPDKGAGSVVKCPKCGFSFEVTA
jgi:hypothetical protein